MTKNKEENMKTIKLKKEEIIFLIDWLSDDLHIELEKEKSDFPNPIARKFLPTIIKKLENTERRNNDTK